MFRRRQVSPASSLRKIPVFAPPSFSEVSGLNLMVLYGPARTVRCGQGDNLMVHAVMERVEPGDVVLAGPCFHAYPLGLATYFALAAGATVVLRGLRLGTANGDGPRNRMWPARRANSASSSKESATSKA